MNVNHTLQIALKQYQTGDLLEAEKSFIKLVKVQPANADALHFLGIISYQKGNFDSAVQYYKKAIQFNPNISGAYNNLGLALQGMGRLDEALVYYQKALEQNPNDAGALYNLGNVFLISDKLDEAVESYNQALSIDPNFHAAHLNKGSVLHLQGKFGEALQSYHLLLQRNPNAEDVLTNMGNLLKDLGKLDDAEVCFKRVLQGNPHLSSSYSNLLFSMNFNPYHDAETIFSEHLKFAKLYEAPLSKSILHHMNTCLSSGRLKIGYVSPDFRSHSVAYFIEPVINSHNRDDFEIFCYSLVVNQDDVTKRIQENTDEWRNVSGITDDKIADIIRKDGIDILVDLAGHTANNRILVFARKPAPVQVTWIGYPATTGLSAMDYKIVDNYTDPIGLTEKFYTEELIRLPGNFLCYLPDKDSPEVNDLPALKTGHVTFGSFNNFAKVSPELISLWVNILKKIPSSRLTMKALSFSDTETRHYVKGIFKREGIDEERIDFLSWETSTKGHLSRYYAVDIGLDTFPYNGVTTTCEAMWMGIPVITLEGDTHVSRVGTSILSNIGLSECIAKTPEEYMQIAVDLSQGLDRLQSLRKNLRNMMSHSPLMDRKRFIVNLEKAYKDMWQEWCSSA